MAEVVIPNVDCDGVLTGTPNSPTSVFRPFDCVKTLTHEQVKAGWRESFSAKEGRSYFYNVITRESVWIIPTITKPVQREQRRMVDSTPSDMLAAAVDRLGCFSDRELWHEGLPIIQNGDQNNPD